MKNSIVKIETHGGRKEDATDSNFKEKDKGEESETNSKVVQEKTADCLDELLYHS